MQEQITVEEVTTAVANAKAQTENFAEQVEQLMVKNCDEPDTFNALLAILEPIGLSVHMFSVMGGILEMDSTKDQLDQEKLDMTLMTVEGMMSIIDREMQKARDIVGE